jgi:hypothetical protein
MLTGQQTCCASMLHSHSRLIYECKSNRILLTVVRYKSVAVIRSDFVTSAAEASSVTNTHMCVCVSVRPWRFFSFPVLLHPRQHKLNKKKYQPCKKKKLNMFVIIKINPTRPGTEKFITLIRRRVVKKTTKDGRGRICVQYYRCVCVFGDFFFFTPCSTYFLDIYFFFPYYSPLLSSSSEGVVSPHGTSGCTGARIVRAPVVHRRWLTRPPTCVRCCCCRRSGSTFCNSRSPSKKISSYRLIIIILCVW